jgi:peptidoglycan DL-endopeptidase CwlO
VRRMRLVARLVVALIAVVAISAGRVVFADPVADQQQRVKAIADQLDALSARIDRLDLEYNAALDRENTLSGEVADAQVKVAALQTQVDSLEQSLGVIAVDTYTSGTPQLSPLFASPSSYSDAQQRADLSHLSIDSGAGDVDQARVTTVQLANSRADLAGKQRQSVAVVAALAQKQAEASTLIADYKSRSASATATLGDLVQQEQARRAAETTARADAAAAQQAAAVAPTTTGVTNHSQALVRPSPTVPSVAATNSGVRAVVPARGNGVAVASAAKDPAQTGASTSPDAQPAPTTSNPSSPLTTPPTSAPPPSSRASIVVAAAMSQLGVPYVFAAESPGVAFDCSGLSKWAWGRAGITLPHLAASQYADTPHVTRDQIQPGDLIFYDAPIEHVAIYIGDGQFVHAPHTGDVVRTGTVDWSTVVGISRPG